MKARFRWGALVLLAPGLLACEPRASEGEAPSPEAPAPVEASGGAALPAASPGAPGRLRSLDVRALGDRRFHLTGTAVQGVPTVEVTIEDGHNVLYGPETVPVEGGRFTVEVEVGASPAERVFAYLHTPDGGQLVVPIDMGAQQR